MSLPFYLEQLDPRAYLTLPRITLDLETTNLEYGDARVGKNHVVLGYATRNGSNPSCFSGSNFALWCNRLFNSTLPHLLVAHNAKFELAWLIRAGVDISNLLVWDTMIAEYVLAGNIRVPLNLDSVGARYGLGRKEPVIDALMQGGVCPSEMPRHLLWERVKRDVATTDALFLKQRDKLNDLGLLPVMFTRCITTPVLAYVEREGMGLDSQRVYEEYLKVNGELKQVSTDLVDLAGGANLRSGKQMAKLLYDTLGFDEVKSRDGTPERTKSGVPKTDAATLERLKGTTDDQKKFLELRKRYGKLDAAITKSLTFFRGVCDEYGGQFYGNFNQTVTKTHRLSSSGRKLKFRDGSVKGVQFQNLPREYKRLFTARDSDNVLVEVDGAQLEFRAAAFLGHDPVACQDIVDEADVHSFTASVIFGVPEDKVSKKQRTAAKAHTFKPLFGGQSGTPSEKAYYAAFKEKYKQIAKTQEDWKHEVLRTKCLVMPWGFRAYWPNCRVSRTGYVEHTTEIYNLPIQSFATADVIPVSLAYTFWLARARGLMVRITNTVHDSVLAEVAKVDVEAYRNVAKEAFLDRTYRYIDKVYNMEMDVPLGLGFTAGSHWGEGEEEKYSTPYKKLLVDSK